MKSVIISSTFALLAATASAVPLEKRTDFPPPAGGFENVNYPPGTGENLDSYPPPSGGFENIQYPPGIGSNAAGCPASGPFTFTSTFHIEATPDQVVNGTTNPTPTGGLPGALGFYDFGINSDLDLICYSIKFVGFRGNYQSAARTATHVHAGAKGQNGPPRLVFPNPTGDGNERFSYGCMQGKSSCGPMLYLFADVYFQDLSLPACLRTV